MTLEKIQKELVAILGDIKPTTKIGRVVEFAYIAGLRHAGAEIPPICAICLMTGRSVTLFKPKPDSK